MNYVFLFVAPCIVPLFTSSNNDHLTCDKHTHNLLLFFAIYTCRRDKAPEKRKIQ